MNLIWEAGASSVTTWNTGNFDVNGNGTVLSGLTVDLSAYTVTGESSLTLVSYSGTLTGAAFGAVNVFDGSGDLTEGVDYTLSYGDGSNDAIILTVIPEPGTYALIGGMLALGYVMVRRRA